MIRCENTGGALRIFFKTRLVFDHHPNRPAIELGSGEGSYRMNHGSFRIRDRRLKRQSLGACAIVENGPTRVAIDFGGALTSVFAVVDGRLEITFAGAAARHNRFWLRLPADPAEHIYGCGEQYSVLDLRGRRVPLWVQEQGVGRGRDLITLLANLHSGSGGSWHSTYYSQPTFVSSDNYFCHVDASGYAEFDFRAKRAHILHCWEVPARIVMDVAPSAPDTIRSLSALLGRQVRLPAWTWDGVWLGVQGGTGVIDRKLADALEAGVRVGALWVQDWQGRRITSFGSQLMWNWRYDPERYAGLPDYIAGLKRRGIRFLGYINCFLAVGTTDSARDPVPPHFLYAEAKEKGYCVKNAAGEDYLVTVTTFPAAILDLTNPAAVEWIKKVIRENMIDLGLDGWMADFGEYLPVDARCRSGESAERVHNQYPVLWAQANHEAVDEAGRGGDIVFFMRAGSTGSSHYAASIWAGDQLVNWSRNDGLATVIPAAISLGFCGIGFHHSDIGGYTTVAWIRRRRELFMRWAEAAAFTPIMRTHEGNRPEVNWQFNSDAETLAHFARMSRVFTHLKDYHQALADEYVARGLPPVRHPYIHYEDDPVVHRLIRQYLYGRDLMVAPVCRRGARTERVYLPADEWIHAWSGAVYGGGWHRVPAPLGQPPVFYRAASSFTRLFEGLWQLT